MACFNISKIVPCINVPPHGYDTRNDMNDNRELQQVVGMPDEKQLEAMLGPK